MYPTPPAGYVFSSEAQIAGTNIAYASTPFTSYGGGSVVLAQTTISPGSFAASESSYTSPYEGPGSFFNFTAAAGTTPYTSAGFPVFSAGDSGIGAFYFSIQSPEIEYSITSITLAPVPLPGSAWLMLAGLGGLGMFLRRDCKLR
jgi:hypothetical protein